MNCWDEHDRRRRALGAPCEWIQFWVELDSDAKAAAYHDFLVSYSQEQIRAGRVRAAAQHAAAQRHGVARLQARWCPSDARLQTWVALGFLLVCLVNTVGLLAHEVPAALGGDRRAARARRVEAVDLPAAARRGRRDRARRRRARPRRSRGSACGRCATSPPTTPSSRSSICRCSSRRSRSRSSASLLAGLLPAWRGCQVAPALQLKSH